MKYQANPVIVDAFKIIGIEPMENGDTIIRMEEQKDEFIATKAMTARIDVKVGDYMVVQSDGYIYLNPADVFKRKYSPLVEN